MSKATAHSSAARSPAAEALKREKARQRQLDCTDKACLQAAQQEIDELNALDAWRDAQIEVACRTASSASCQSWSMAIQAAKLSFEGVDGREDTTGSIRLERAQVNEAAFMYGQRTNNPAAYGVAKGLLKLVPPVALASAGIGAYELTGAILEHGMADTAIAIAQGIKEVPADIKARLSSDDPAVRGEALVEALAIGGSAAYVGAKLAQKAGQSFAQTLAKEHAAQAEARAIAKAKMENNFYAEGAPTQLGKSKLITNSDEAIFWSGRTEGVGGIEAAKEIANRHRGSTLEQLIERRQIQMPDFDPTKPETVRAWIDVSTELARNASGEVRVVLGESVRPKSIWELHELPALKSNLAVTKVVAIDPKTGVHKVIFERGRQ